MERHIPFSLTLAFLLSLSPSSLFSTTLKKMGLKELVRASDLIISGEVKEVIHDRGIGEGEPPFATFVEIEPEIVLKGDAPPEGITLRELGGSVDGINAFVPLAPRFAKGERVFLFLEESGSGYFRCTGFFQGKFNILREKGTGDDIMVRGIVPVTVLHYDPSILRPPEKRLPLREFMDRVEKMILEEGK